MAVEIENVGRPIPTTDPRDPLVRDLGSRLGPPERVIETPVVLRRVTSPQGLSGPTWSHLNPDPVHPGTDRGFRTHRPIPMSFTGVGHPGGLERPEEPTHS